MPKAVSFIRKGDTPADCVFGSFSRRPMSVLPMRLPDDISDFTGRAWHVERVSGLITGGAVPIVEASTHEPGFEAKSVRQLPEKETL